MKKLLVIFSFLILSSTVFATSVGGSIGGWTVISQVASGIGQKLTATKEVIVNGSSKLVKGTAMVTTNAAELSKFMARSGTAAVVVSALDLLLDGVDYVMDPANNTIQIKEKPVADKVDDFTDNTGKYTSKYIYIYKSSSSLGGNKTFKSYDLVNTCSMYLSWWMTIQNTYKYSSIRQNTSSSCFYDSFIVKDDKPFGSNPSSLTVQVLANPDFNQEKDDELKKTIPLSDVASQVLDQAEKDLRAGNPKSPAVELAQAAAAAKAQAIPDDPAQHPPYVEQFGKNPEYPTVEEGEGAIGEPTVDPETGEPSTPFSFKFPKACDWLPQLCSFIDWMQKPEDLDDPKLPKKEFDEKEIDEELLNIHASSCPAPIDINIPLPVFNTVYTDSISISEYCSEIEKLAPVLQVLAFVLAVMIIREV